MYLIIVATLLYIHRIIIIIIINNLYSIKILKFCEWHFTFNPQYNNNKKYMLNENIYTVYYVQKYENNKIDKS